MPTRSSPCRSPEEESDAIIPLSARRLSLDSADEVQPVCQLFVGRGSTGFSVGGEEASSESLSVEMDRESFLYDNALGGKPRAGQAAPQSQRSSFLSFGSDYQNVSVGDLWARHPFSDSSEPDVVQIQKPQLDDAWAVFSS